jgi:hypothetical protein
MHYILIQCYDHCNFYYITNDHMVFELVVTRGHRTLYWRPPAVSSAY